MDHEDVFDDLVLNADLPGGILQEPDGPLDGALVALGVFGAEGPPEQVAQMGAGGIGVADRAEPGAPEMPVCVNDFGLGHYKVICALSLVRRENLARRPEEIEVGPSNRATKMRAVSLRRTGPFPPDQAGLGESWWVRPVRLGHPKQTYLSASISSLTWNTTSFSSKSRMLDWKGILGQPGLRDASTPRGRRGLICPHRLSALQK